MIPHKGFETRYHRYMNDPIPQFGELPSEPTIERPSTYAVVFNDNNQILAIEVNGEYHLPGGGIDKDESPRQAVIREILEESGYHIKDLKFLGQANQWVDSENSKNINKIGTFYTATVDYRSDTPLTEKDHHPCWLDPNELLGKLYRDFHRWAVQYALTKY